MSPGNQIIDLNPWGSPVQTWPPHSNASTVRSDNGRESIRNDSIGDTALRRRIEPSADKLLVPSDIHTSNLSRSIGGEE